MTGLVYLLRSDNSLLRFEESGVGGSAVPQKKQAEMPASLPLELRFVFYANLVGGFFDPRLHAQCPRRGNLQLLVGVFESFGDSID